MQGIRVRWTDHQRSSEGPKADAQLDDKGQGTPESSNGNRATLEWRTKITIKLTLKLLLDTDQPVSEEDLNVVINSGLLEGDYYLRLSYLDKPRDLRDVRYVGMRIIMVWVFRTGVQGGFADRIRGQIQEAYDEEELYSTVQG